MIKHTLQCTDVHHYYSIVNEPNPLSERIFYETMNLLNNSFVRNVVRSINVRYAL